MISYRTFRTYIQGHEGVKYLTMVFLVILLFLSVIFSTFIGSVHISFTSVLQIYGSQIPFFSRFIPENFTATQYTIIASIREPEVLGGLVVGASLGIGGAVIQSIFRNPITEPYIIGLSSGAALGAVMTIILGLTFLGLYTQQLLAFIFAMASVIVVYMFALRGGKAHPTYMLLTGVALSFFLSAIVALLLFSNINLEDEAFFWLLGSLENINWLELFPVSAVVLLCSVLLGSQYRELDALQMGDTHARSVGVNVERTKGMSIFLVALSVSASVSISGLIGFVGLIMPHVSRIIFGGSNRFVLPGSAITGAIFLILADDIARGSVVGVVIPIGIITGIIGVPFFLLIMRRLAGGRYET